MKWFRDKTRQGTSFALLALAINLALSFGHLHLQDLDRNGLRGGEADAGILLSAIGHRDSAPGNKHDGHPDDLCPICMAQAALGTGLAAAAPALPVDLASVEIDPIALPEQSVAQRPRAGFRSRGPPLS
jgi:hypothetical protein